MDWHTGKVAVVTGGARNIGRGIALVLANHGAHVAIVDLEAERAAATADEIRAMGRRSLAVTADLTRRAEAERATAEVLAAFGQIDYLINNAGTGGAPGWPERTPPSREDWDVAWAVNVRSHAFMAEAVYPQMIARTFGKIVHVASIAAWSPAGHQMHYGASKAADINYMQSLAYLLGPHNINVNAVCPGLVWTDMTRGTQEQLQVRYPERAGRDTRETFLESVSRAIPLGREQTPEDIGNAVSFLCSERARNIHGQAINVDGGATVH